MALFVAETTAMNPQFHIQIPRSGAAKCHVVVSVGCTVLYCTVLYCTVLLQVTQQYETNQSNNKKKRTLHHIG